jgi:hypothetical protein
MQLVAEPHRLGREIEIHQTHAVGVGAVRPVRPVGQSMIAA